MRDPHFEWTAGHWATEIVNEWTGELAVEVSQYDKRALVDLIERRLVNAHDAGAEPAALVEPAEPELEPASPDLGATGASLLVDAVNGLAGNPHDIYDPTIGGGLGVATK